MDRRSFLKLIGGIAALPIVGKYVKIAKKGADVVTPKVLKEQGMPEYFYSLIEGVKRFGKKIKSGRDEDVFEYTDPKTKQKVKVTDGRDETFVDFETDRGSRGTMGVRKGQADETTKGMTPPDEYMEMEEVYRMGGDDYYKDIDEFISGGTEGIEQLYKRLPKAGGGSVGMPPVPKTDLPLYFNQQTGTEIGIANQGGIGIEGIMGNFRMGVGKPITGPGNLGDTGAFLEYRRQFADGGVSSGPPPRKGPNSQGIETLFQTR